MSISSDSDVEVESRDTYEPFFITSLAIEYLSPKNVAPIKQEPPELKGLPWKMEDAPGHATKTWASQDTMDMGGEQAIEDNTPNLAAEKLSGETRDKWNEPLREREGELSLSDSEAEHFMERSLSPLADPLARIQFRSTSQPTRSSGERRRSTHLMRQEQEEFASEIDIQRSVGTLMFFQTPSSTFNSEFSPTPSSSATPMTVEDLTLNSDSFAHLLLLTLTPS